MLITLCSCAKNILSTKDSHSTTKALSIRKKVISTSKKDYGWCTFYDAEKSYKVDGHTDVYYVCVKKDTTKIELRDKTARIIYAGTPVILHLNNIMEDGTHCAVLTETENKPNPYANRNLLAVSSTGEKISGLRLAFTPDVKLGFFPWETNNAEAGIVYLSLPNSLTETHIQTVSDSSSRWILLQRKPIGRYEGSTHRLRKATFKKNIDVRYVSSPNDEYRPKAIPLKGQLLKRAEGNEYIDPMFLIGNIAFESTIWGKHYYHACNLDNNEWGSPEFTFQCDEFNPNKIGMALFAKTSDNSLIISNLHFNIKKHNIIVIPNADKIENIADTTKWKKYDISKFEDMMAYSSSNFYPLSDSTYLIVAAQKENIGSMFAIIDFKNEKRHLLDFLPDDGIKIDSVVKQHVYSLNSKVFGNGNGRYLYKARSERYSFIFTINGNKVNVKNYIYNAHPYYEQIDTYKNYIKYRVHHEEFDISATSDNIFVLLTDRNKFGKKITSAENSFYYGDIVEMYDWNGKQQKRILKLDHIGQRIVISDDGKTLYLFTDDYNEGEPNPQTWAYDISNLDVLPTMDFLEALDTQYEYVEEDAVESSITPTKTVEEGDMMADFELFDYDDKPHHLNEFLGKGKYTILEFSGLRCGPCQMAKPLLEKLYQANRDKLEMITISTDYENIWKRKPAGEVSWHEWNDHKSAREISIKYGVSAIPTFIIISPEGKIEKKCVGVQTFLNAIKIKSRK